MNYWTIQEGGVVLEEGVGLEEEEEGEELEEEEGVGLEEEGEGLEEEEKEGLEELRWAGLVMRCQNEEILRILLVLEINKMMINNN